MQKFAPTVDYPGMMFNNAGGSPCYYAGPADLAPTELFPKPALACTMADKYARIGRDDAAILMAKICRKNIVLPKRTEGTPLKRPIINTYSIILTPMNNLLTRVYHTHVRAHRRFNAV